MILQQTKEMSIVHSQLTHVLRLMTERWPSLLTGLNGGIWNALFSIVATGIQQAIFFYFLHDCISANNY